MNTQAPKDEGVVNPFAHTTAQGPNPEDQQELKDLLASTQETETEEDGESFFWIVQRVIWGVFKSFIVLFILFGVIWLIWGVRSASDEPSSPGTSAQTTQTKNETTSEDLDKAITQETSDIVKSNATQKDSGFFKSIGSWFGGDDVQDSSSKNSEERPSGQVSKGGDHEADEYHPHPPGTPHMKSCRGRNIWTTSSGTQELSIDLRDNFKRRNYPRLERLRRAKVRLPQQGSMGASGRAQGDVTSNRSNGDSSGVNDTYRNDSWTGGNLKGGADLGPAGDLGGDTNLSRVRSGHSDLDTVSGNFLNQSPQTNGMRTQSALTSTTRQSSLSQGSRSAGWSPSERLVRVGEALAGLAYQTDHDSLVGQSTAWLKAARDFSAIESQKVYAQASPETRAQKIGARIAQGEKLVQESALIRKALQDEIKLWQNTLTQNQTAAQNMQNLMHEGVGNYQGSKAAQAMGNFAAASQNVAISSVYIEMYQSLLKNVNNFEGLLRQGSIPLFEAS